MNEETQLFELLILSISHAALLALGEDLVSSDAPKEACVNMEDARFHIETLNMLKKKTKGNLGQSEQQMLDRILYDLQLKLVELNSDRV